MEELKNRKLESGTSSVWGRRYIHVYTYPGPGIVGSGSSVVIIPTTREVGKILHGSRL